VGIPNVSKYAGPIRANFTFFGSIPGTRNVQLFCNRLIRTMSVTVAESDAGHGVEPLEQPAIASESS
jgi:hypothetical protein